MRPLAGSNSALTYTVTVQSGGTDSSEVDLEGFPLVGFVFPTITSTSMKFKVSNQHGGTFVALKDNTGADVSVTVASNTGVALTPTLMAQLGAFRFVKLVMGSAEGADRVISICVKG